MLTTAIALTVGAKAQYSQYGGVENFYEANPDLVASLGGLFRWFL
jgi:hypothetical protein